MTGKWTIERRQFVEERAWECLKACEYVTEDGSESTLLKEGLVGERKVIVWRREELVEE